MVTSGFVSWVAVEEEEEDEEEDDGGQEERKAEKISHVESAGLKSIRLLPVKEGLQMPLALVVGIVCGVSVLGRASVVIFDEDGRIAGTVFAD